MVYSQFFAFPSINNCVFSLGIAGFIVVAKLSDSFLIVGGIWDEVTFFK